MKYAIVILVFIFPLLVGSACRQETADPANNTKHTDAETMSNKITITIGSKIFNATLESNATASKFKSMLPLTLNMQDLNSNEKFFDFADGLPTNASNPRTINTGDLMLWQSNTLVLFYKSFSTSYTYTRLGKIENPSGLAEVLGSGDVNVKFDLQR